MRSEVQNFRIMAYTRNGNKFPQVVRHIYDRNVRSGFMLCQYAMRPGLYYCRYDPGHALESLVVVH